MAGIREITKIFNTARNRLVATAVALAFLGFVTGWNLILKADFNKLANLTKEKETWAKKESVLKNIATLENKIKPYRSFAIEPNETSWLIETINKIAGESGVTLTSIAPQGTQTIEDYEKIFLGLETECGYHELGDFASRLENFSRFIRIRSLSINRAPNQSKKTLTVMMSVCAFRPLGQMKDILS